jgi:hypothetical protein
MFIPLGGWEICSPSAPEMHHFLPKGKLILFLEGKTRNSSRILEKDGKTAKTIACNL